MIVAILILLFLSLLDKERIRTGNFKPLFQVLFWIFFVNFIILGWIGQQPAESPFIELGMGATFIYFFTLIIGLPFCTKLENFLLTQN